MNVVFAYPAPLIQQRGLEPYLTTFDAMRSFTDARDAATPDEIWIVEHLPVYTLGLAADPLHVLDAHGIPLVQTDRGGEVTYHGPGQALIYLLFDLRRRKTRMLARELVRGIEQAAIDTLAAYNLSGERKTGAPGIYLSDGPQRGAKIAALGLKIRGNGYTYHGVSLNVAMDLEPFAWINPCGYAGLAITDMRSLGVTAGLHEVQQRLTRNLLACLFSAAPRVLGA